MFVIVPDEPRRGAESARLHPGGPVRGIDVVHVLHGVIGADRQRRVREHVRGECLQLVGVRRAGAEVLDAWCRPGVRTVIRSSVCGLMKSWTSASPLVPTTLMVNE